MRLDTLHYCRDKTDNEVDLVEEAEGRITLTEIKSGMTLALDGFDSLHRLGTKLPGVGACRVVCGGATECKLDGVDVASWKSLVSL